MQDEEELIDKVKVLVRRARLPRFLNRFGPKGHPLWEFVLARLVFPVHGRTWRGTAKFMREFYKIRLHWTSWQKAVAKWPLWVWHVVGRASAGDEPCSIAAIDGTTFSRSNPSEHYLRRIDREGSIGRPVQDVVMIDVKRRKFLSWRVRATPRGEKCDVPYLIEHTPHIPKGVLLDKGFDSNPLHEWLRERDIWSIAPVRKGCKRGQYRRQLRDCFDWGLYWQRNIVEALFSAIKRIFGTHVRARTWKAQHAEISSRLIAYNIGAKLSHDFLLSHKAHNVFIPAGSPLRHVAFGLPGGEALRGARAGQAFLGYHA